MGADIPLSLHTAYAELLERCATADFEETFAEDGVFTPKTVRGRRYWYFQVTEDGKRKQRYVGPETEELLARIASHKQAREDQRERQAIVSALVRAAHLPRPDADISAVLAALSKAGVFRLRGVLVGTAAFQTYAAMLGARFVLKDIYQTDDVDIAQFVEISRSVEDEIPKMLAVLRAEDPSFQPVPYSPDSGRVAIYKSRKLRVDFLTPNRGPERNEPQELRALGTDAQPLRFLDFLIHEPEPAVILNGPGIYVKVPAPQRYAIHKLIISRRRGAGTAKTNKDTLQAQWLLGVLARQRPYDLRAAWDEAYGRGRTWRRLLLEGLSMIDAAARDDVLRIVELKRNAVPGLSLQFDPAFAHYDMLRDIAVFRGEARGQQIQCAISREALDDHFGADGLDQKGRLEQFRKHRDIIEEMARIKYLEWPIEEPGSVLLKTLDVEKLKKDVRKRSSIRYQ